MKNNTPPITPFQHNVYAATRQIPRGKITTYKLLAEAIGCKSSQAVGQALKRNPFAPEVPCHRVISHNLTIGGYSGHRSGKLILKKLKLLKEEGVEFNNGRLVDENQIFRFKR